MTFLVMNDPSVIHQIYTGQGQEVAKNLGQTVKERIRFGDGQTRSKSSGDMAPVALIPAGPAGGSPQGTTISANSATVPPPSLAWPAASTATSLPPFTAPQPQPPHSRPVARRRRWRDRSQSANVRRPVLAIGPGISAAQLSRGGAIVTRFDGGRTAAFKRRQAAALQTE